VRQVAQAASHVFQQSAELVRPVRDGLALKSFENTLRHGHRTREEVGDSGPSLAMLQYRADARLESVQVRYMGWNCASAVPTNGPKALNPRCS
jgi:hypothetical protein